MPTVDMLQRSRGRDVIRVIKEKGLWSKETPQKARSRLQVGVKNDLLSLGGDTAALNTLQTAPAV